MRAGTVKHIFIKKVDFLLIWTRICDQSPAYDAKIMTHAKIMKKRNASIYPLCMQTNMYKLLQEQVEPIDSKNKQNLDIIAFPVYNLDFFNSKKSFSH